eukprot:2307518-Rhodomonas_salina.2
MSGTDLAYGTIVLRVCYAMSGADLAYGARSGFCLQFRWVTPSGLPTRCPARAARCPVLRECMEIYRPTLCLGDARY